MAILNLDHPAAAIKVMLVDDHRSVLWGLEKLIEGEHPRMEVVGTATTLAEAMRLLEKTSPDVIVMDIDLNGESGISAIPKIIAQSNAKVLTLTGSRDHSLHDAAVINGAKGVVEKGEDATTILKAIEKVAAGEIWLDRAATSRIFLELSQKRAAMTLDPEQNKIASLTPRERQIVSAIGSDAAANSRIISERLYISEHTLRNHLTSIYEKLDLSSRLELFAYASKHNLIKAEPSSGRNASNA